MLSSALASLAAAVPTGFATSVRAGTLRCCHVVAHSLCADGPPQRAGADAPRCCSRLVCQDGIHRHPVRRLTDRTTALRWALAALLAATPLLPPPGKPGATCEQQKGDGGQMSACRLLAVLPHQQSTLVGCARAPPCPASSVPHPTHYDAAVQRVRAVRARARRRAARSGTRSTSLALSATRRSCGSVHPS